MCLWDIFGNYVKEKKPKSKTHRNTYLNFKPGHSQQTTHCLKRLENPVIPVFMGYRVPRNDSEGDKLKYAVVMLTLFRPWSTVKSSPLKSMDTAWPDALHELEHVRVTLNMQLLYQTRDAKFDFAVRRGKRLVELMRKAKNSGIDVDEEGDEDFDPVLKNAMQAVVDPEDLDGTVAILSKNTRATRDAENIVNAAKNSGFYCVQPGTDSELISNFEGHKTRKR